MLISAKRTTIFIAVCLTSCTGAIAAQTANYDLSSYTSEDAYRAGRIMRAQFKEESARAYLKYAADKGNADAAYLYAMDITGDTDGHVPDDEAKLYLLQAAKQDNLNAIHYLFSQGSWLRDGVRYRWKRLYHDGLIRLAATKPGKATFKLAQYYYHTDKIKYQYYLDKSINYNYPYAIIANIIGMDNLAGNKANPVVTEDSIDTIIKVARTGFMPAVRLCIDYYEQNEDFMDAWRWRQRALQLGDLTSLAIVAKIYAGRVPSYAFVREDLPRAYAYGQVYLDNAGNSKFSNVFDMMENLYTDLKNDMSPEQLKKAGELVSTTRSSVTFYSFDSYWDK